MKLSLGTVIPRPGPGRVPVIQEVHLDPPEDPAFAIVDYVYEGDEVGHSLGFYRDAAGRWLVDVVWELSNGGAMQEALGRVQVPGCQSEKLEV